MRVLLVNPVIRGDENPKYFPVGLGMIYSVLARAGHDLHVVDLNALRPDPQTADALLAEHEYDLVGLTGLITEYAQVRDLAARLRVLRPDRPIVLGGGLASSADDYVIRGTEVDVCVRGEGEETVVALVERIESGASLYDVSGITYRDGETLVTNPCGPPIKDLDALPLPERAAFPAEVYLEGMKSCWMFPTPRRAISVLTSRGCPYRCVYCDKAIWGNRFRQRSAAAVVDEIVHLRDRFGIEAVVFSDDTFVLRRQFVVDFCEEMMRRAPEVGWVGNGRVGRLDRELVSLMKRAGCLTLGFGIESGSQTILDELNKGITVEQMVETIRWVKEAGIRPLGYMVVGSFSETPETVAESIDFLHRVKIRSGVNFLTPFPGTALHERARLEGKVNGDLGDRLERWDAWQKNLLVNLTGMSDEELARQREALEKVAFSYF